MSKVLECGAVFPGCKFVIHGDSDDEVMLKAMEHARAEHDTPSMSERLKARVRAAIKDERGDRTASVRS
jgi:predicted small metal-binding protein